MYEEVIAEPFAVIFTVGLYLFDKKFCYWDLSQILKIGRNQCLMVVRLTAFVFIVFCYVCNLHWVKLHFPFCQYYFAL